MYSSQLEVREQVKCPTKRYCTCHSSMILIFTTYFQIPNVSLIVNQHMLCNCKDVHLIISIISERYAVALKIYI